MQRWMHRLLGSAALHDAAYDGHTAPDGPETAEASVVPSASSPLPPTPCFLDLA